MCTIDIYSKYALIIPLKDKKGPATTLFIQILHESDRKPNKIWVDKASKFFNRLIKFYLEDNVIEMYSTHNERKSVVTERFIRTLKKIFFKYMISTFKNLYTNKLDDIVNKYNDVYHRTNKMKFIDVKSTTYIDFDKKE